MKIIPTLTAIAITAGLIGCHETPSISESSLAGSLPFASIDDIKSILEKGESCTSITQVFRDRINMLDDTSGLNAITVVNPNALEIAKEIDLEYGSNSDERPALLCVPFVVKDNIDTVSMPTTGGSSYLADTKVKEDAFIFGRLVDAGALPIAKTNMAEWAFSPRQTVSATYGRTANAYNLNASPAGSSGGTASAIAAGFAVIGIGTDTGNSVRGPSSHLGLTGLRPTLGLVSRNGIIPLSFDRDIAGPITRTARDAAHVMAVIAGRDSSDPYTDSPPTLDYIGKLSKADLQGKKIGVLTDLVSPARTDPEIFSAFQEAMNSLEEAGASIGMVSITNFEMLANDESMYCPRFGYDLRRYLKFRTGEDAMRDLLRYLLENEIYGADTLVPEGLKYFASFPDDLDPNVWGEPCYDLEQNPARQAFRVAVIAALEAGAYDALAYPSWAMLPATIDRAHEDYAGDNNQIVSPPTGLPAITTPMGFSASGLPMGLQLLGRPFSDADLLALAHAFETETAHWRAPESFSALDANPQN